jgi:hypothetical protein
MTELREFYLNSVEKFGQRHYLNLCGRCIQEKAERTEGAVEDSPKDKACSELFSPVENLP